MAIGQAVLINQVSGNYNENLLPYFSTFNDAYTWNITDGTDAVIENNVLRRAKGDRSMLVTFTGTNETTFNASGTVLDTTILYDGLHKISMAFFISSDDQFVIDDDPSEVSFTIAVSVNGITTDETTFQCDIKASEGFIFDKWNTFAQLLSVEAGDVLNYTFKVQSNNVGLKLFVDEFMLTIDDKKEGEISPYREPKTKTMTFQSRVDVTNTQNISADTETNFGFTGVSNTNSSVTLLTTTGLITPTKVNNAVAVDFYFDFDAPSGTDRFVDMFLKVNSVTYRASTFTLSKTAGQKEYVSGSFTLPVLADFKTYGGQISIISTEAIVIENRYINVLEQTNI